jgi:hypothetical protein
VTSGGKGMLTPDQIWEILVEVAELAKSQERQVALVGGVALQLYGSDRYTKDVDIVADRPMVGVPIRQMAIGGHVMTMASGREVDVVEVARYQRLCREALATAQPIADVPIPVAQPEYIAAMKMVANRKKDEADLEFLVSERKIDRDKARDIIERHLGPYAADEFTSMADEIDWMKSTGRR